MAKLATCIANVPHLAAFDDMVKARLEGIDLSPILVYVVDTTPAEGLYYLADQFDVLGWKGWNLAATEADRRALIKKAIELHRYKGTVWAVKEAVRSVGYLDAKVVEHVGLDYNGLVNYDGSETYSGGQWYNFRVVIGLADGIEIDATTTELATRLINEYKNVRSILVDISFTLSFQDFVPTHIDTMQLTIHDGATTTTETL